MKRPRYFENNQKDNQKSMIDLTQNRDMSKFKNKIKTIKSKNGKKNIILARSKMF